MIHAILDCRTCLGTGRIRRKDAGGEDHLVTCPACGGSGTKKMDAVTRAIFRKHR